LEEEECGLVGLGWVGWVGRFGHIELGAFDIVPRSLHYETRAKGARVASVGMTGF